MVVGLGVVMLVIITKDRHRAITRMDMDRVSIMPLTRMDRAMDKVTTRYVCQWPLLLMNDLVDRWMI